MKSLLMLYLIIDRVPFLGCKNITDRKWRNVNDQISTRRNGVKWLNIK